MEKRLTICYQEFDSMEGLCEEDRELMRRAMDALEGAYAPYSGFCVGAAVRLHDGSVVTGSNQENAAYPSGLCAERTAMFAASAQRPDCRCFDAIAIVGRDAEGRLCEASPCGACRQVMLEYEGRQGYEMRVVCYLGGGRVRVAESASSLLPFSFKM